MARPEHISTETILAALVTRPEATAAELASVLEIGKSTAAKRLAAMEGTGSVRRIPGGREAGVRVADRWVRAGSPQTAPVAETGQECPKASTRLGRGALRAMVLDYVRSQPGEASPSAIASVLGHSAGAVGNALAKLADAGEVRLSSVSPRRYARAD